MSPRKKTKGVVRTQNYIPYTGDGDDMQPLYDERPAWERPIDLPVSIEELYLALDELTDKQRFVFMRRWGLFDGEYYSYRAIARCMGVSHQTVKEHEEAAKKRLNKIIEAKNTLTPLYRVRESFAEGDT